MPDKRLNALDRHLTKAITHIVQLMTDENAPPTVQLNACKIYIELHMKYRVNADLDDRVKSIEEHFTVGEPQPFVDAEPLDTASLFADDEQDSEEL